MVQCMHVVRDKWCRDSRKKRALPALIVMSGSWIGALWLMARISMLGSPSCDILNICTTGMKI